MKKIKLTKGCVCLIDDSDYESISKNKWCLNFSEKGKYKYAYRRENNKSIHMHRQIMNTKKGQYVDHINGNGLDNRRSNLRIVTNQQNAWNSKKTKRKTQSKYKGVTKSGKYTWRAEMRIKGIKSHLGTFKTEKEAAIKYNEMAKKHYGEYACLNKL